MSLREAFLATRGMLPDMPPTRASSPCAQQLQRVAMPPKVAR